MKEYTGDDLAKLGPASMAETEALIKEIKKLLQGKSPMVQGGALADIVAMYFAGHHPQVREVQFESWMKAMQGLIEVNEEAILDAYGMTDGWKKKPRQ